MIRAWPSPALVYSVTEVTRLIKDKLESDPHLAGVWVRGEIGTCKQHSSGHLYFTLKDKDSSLRCVMFRSFGQRLRFSPSSGLNVLAFGEIGVYERDGSYQLYVRELEPEGLGALFLALEQTKERLAKEGLFRPERKRALPRFPRRVGLITSPVGAALQDIIAVTRRRFPAVQLILAPVTVQGSEAPCQIVQALARLNEEKGIDVIILARGGGTKEDLWTFNDEKVARAVAGSRVPVVSAVGHEIDYTLADLAADVRAPTPSAAAELVVPDRRYLEQQLWSCAERLQGGLRQQLKQRRDRLAHLLASRAWREPASLLAPQHQALAYAREGLKRAGRLFLTQKEARLGELSRSLMSLDPLAVLKRGFAIVQDGQTKAVITRAGQAQPGQKLFVRLADGALWVRVESREEGD